MSYQLTSPIAPKAARRVRLLGPVQIDGESTSALITLTFQAADGSLLAQAQITVCNGVCTKVVENPLASSWQDVLQTEGQTASLPTGFDDFTAAYGNGKTPAKRDAALAWLGANGLIPPGEIA
jgi:hypothetical protein